MIKRISVLMTAYNAGKYVKEAIESILGQSYKNFEFIIVDDHSSDKTWPIIQKFSEKDRRIVAFGNAKNGGIPASRNKAIWLSSGKYLAWQDADDISMPDRIKRQAEYLDAHKNVGVVGGHILIFNGMGEVGLRKYESDDENIRKKIFRYSPVAHPAAMFRRECLVGVGGYSGDYDVAEDLDVLLRVGEKYKFANLQETVVRYRENSSSSTFTKLKKMELNALVIRKIFSKSSSYKMRASDRFFNLMQYASVNLLPPKLRIRLFGLIRNS